MCFVLLVGAGLLVRTIRNLSTADLGMRTTGLLVFGVTPIKGRTFIPSEDVPNGPRVVILGHGLWQRRYAGDPSIVGRTVQIDGNAFEVVGIMPADFVLPTDFHNPAPSTLWLPAQWDTSSTDHGSHGYYAAARLKPGVTIAQAREDLHNLAEAWTTRGLYPRQMQFDTVVLSFLADVIG